MFSKSSIGCWSVLQLPCCPSKQGELTENILQHFFYKLPPQTVLMLLHLFFQHFLADSGVFRAVGHHLVRVHADRLPPLGIQDTGRGARSAGSQHFGQQDFNSLSNLLSITVDKGLRPNHRLFQPNKALGGK